MLRDYELSNRKLTRAALVEHYKELSSEYLAEKKYRIISEKKAKEFEEQAQAWSSHNQTLQDKLCNIRQAISTISQIKFPDARLKALYEPPEDRTEDSEELRILKHIYDLAN